MPRRAVFIALLVGVVGLAAAITPWTISSSALAPAMAARIKDLHGLDLTVSGRSTFALLPVPRLKAETITLAGSDGRSVVRAGLLRGELRILPLMAARLEFAELSLREAVVDVEIDPGGRTSWDAAAAKLGERLQGHGAGRHLQRLVLKGADLHFRDRRSGFETVLRNIELDARWPAVESTLNVAGSMTWRGQPVIVTAASVRPDALAAGRPSRINLQMNAPLARIAASGDLTWRDAPHFVGRTSLETRSLPDFSRWTGLDLPLGPLIQAFSLDGDMTVAGGDASWRSARLTLGSDRLDGALSMRLEGERRTITGTLAADRLDLTGFLAPLVQARAPDGGWSSGAIAIERQSDMDLDLRVSALSARIGSLRMEDLAANLLVKPGRFEASVGRVSINKGIAKGRATLASAVDGIEVKGQSSFERVDVAAFLADLGSPRWLGGAAQGQFTFEGSGETAAEIVQRLHGRASGIVRPGELLGVGLSDALRRVDGKSPLALTGRGGRTPFDQAHLNVTIADGTADIGDGGLTSAAVRAVLQGKVSLTEGTLAVKANVESAAPVEAGSAPSLLFDIAGPWENVTIVPEARPLTQRSGAAGSPPANPGVTE